MQLVRNAAYTLLVVIQWLVFARVVLSWIPLARNHPVVIFIFQITEPIIGPVRKMLDRTSFFGRFGIDFSPLVVFILIDIIKNIVI